MKTKSALAASVTGSWPSAASKPAIFSESLTFIWQPNVRMKKRFCSLLMDRSQSRPKTLIHHGPGVLASRVGDRLPAEHPRHFLDPIFGSEGPHLRDRPPPLHMLADREVPVGLGRDLRQVGHAEDLMVTGDRA